MPPTPCCFSERIFQILGKMSTQILWVRSVVQWHSCERAARYDTVCVKERKRGDKVKFSFETLLVRSFPFRYSVLCAINNSTLTSALRAIYN